MKKLLFIFNPRSGKEQIKNKLMEILDVFAAADYELTVRPTQCAKDAYVTIANKGQDYDLIVAAGGDGTLNESFNGLMKIDREQRPYFGYIPAGTVNDFATTLRISKNPLTAAKGIVNGNKFWCDVGKADTGYFSYIAAFGAFTSVSYETSQESKNALGNIAYVLEGIKNLTNFEDYPMRVEYKKKDGSVVTISDSFIVGMVCNTRSVGGMPLGNDTAIDLQDGLFETILVRMPKNPLEFQQTMNALLMRDLTSERLYFFHSNDVKFYGEKEVSWTLDGEYGGTCKDMSVVNIAKAIKLKYKPVRKRSPLNLLDVEEE